MGKAPFRATLADSQAPTNVSGIRQMRGSLGKTQLYADMDRETSGDGGSRVGGAQRLRPVKRQDECVGVKTELSVRTGGCEQRFETPTLSAPYKAFASSAVEIQRRKSLHGPTCNRIQAILLRKSPRLPARGFRGNRWKTERRFLSPGQLAGRLFVRVNVTTTYSWPVHVMCLKHPSAAWHSGSLTFFGTVFIRGRRVPSGTDSPKTPSLQTNK